MRVGHVSTFPRVTRTKMQAGKVLEEAAEVYSAWERWHENPSKQAVRHMAMEIADVMTACANLAAAYGIEDMHPYIADVEIKNRERGRYE